MSQDTSDRRCRWHHPGYSRRDLERRWVKLVGAVLFAGSYWGIYETHGAAAVYTFYTLSIVGVTLWLWSMYVYIPQNYPTRLRSLGTGWTDGVGHLGAWGGVLIARALFTVANPGPFFIFVTIRARSCPASSSRSSGRTSAAARSRSCPDSRWAAGRVIPPLFPEVSPAARRCHRRPSPHHRRPPAIVLSGGRSAWRNDQHGSKTLSCVRRRFERIGNRDRRPGEFEPVGVAHGGQRPRAGRAGPQRGELFEEALEPRWRGDHQQPARAIADVLEGVRHAPRPERHAAR